MQKNLFVLEMEKILSHNFLSSKTIIIEKGTYFEQATVCIKDLDWTIAVKEARWSLSGHFWPL